MTVLDLVNRWLRYSFNDFIVARHSFEDLYPRQTEISCYHCQQCAEKALKAYLVFNNIEPPRIHDLLKLCQLCMEYDKQFDTMVDICLVLDKYGANVRYPNEISVDEVPSKQAIDKARQVYDFCVSKIPGAQAYDKTLGKT